MMKSEEAELYQAISDRIFLKYNPQKRTDVSDLFKRYKGREKELVELICKKYNVEDDELREYIQEYNTVFQKKTKINGRTGLTLFLIAVVGLFILIKFLTNYHKNEDLVAIKLVVRELLALSQTQNSEPFYSVVKEDYTKITDKKLDAEFTLVQNNNKDTLHLSLVFGKFDEDWCITKFAFSEKHVANIVFSSLPKPIGLKEITNLKDELMKENSTYVKGSFIDEDKIQGSANNAQPSELKSLRADNDVPNKNDEKSLKAPYPDGQEMNSRSDYVVQSGKAYFYDSAKLGTQRKAYLIKGETISVFNDDFQSQFVYVEFMNDNHVITKGWIKRDDLEFLESE